VRLREIKTHQNSGRMLHGVPTLPEKCMMEA
jgi:hypothetical protein